MEVDLHGCRRLAAAVLAKSLIDLLEFALDSPSDRLEYSPEFINSAVQHVLQYDKLVKKLRDTKSKKQIKKWLKELRKELNRA